jgi:AcrR family transcriptional regulator
MGTKQKMSKKDSVGHQKPRGRPASDPFEQDMIIRQAALDILREHGYRKTTMLAIAKKARMSKETLYSRFSSKVTLFESVIQTNAEVMNKDLLSAIENPHSDFNNALLQFGLNLLNLLTSETSISINRAAIELAPEDTIFSHVLLTHGRERTQALFANLIDRAVKKGRLRKLDKKNAATCFVSLLVGDLQHQLLLGVCKRPSSDVIKARARQAVTNFLTLYG